MGGGTVGDTLYSAWRSRKLFNVQVWTAHAWAHDLHEGKPRYPTLFTRLYDSGVDGPAALFVKCANNGYIIFVFHTKEYSELCEIMSQLLTDGS